MMRYLWLTCSALALLVALAGCSSKPDGPPGGPAGGHGGGMMGGRIAISPAGEPLGMPARDEAGYVAAVTEWFHNVDQDKDGILSKVEVEADTARFFLAMDKDADRAVNTRELAEYRASRLSAMKHPAPPEGGEPSSDDASMPRRQGPPGGGGGPGGPGGGAMMGGNGEDMVMAADLNLDFRVTQDELTRKALERLASMDTDKDGKVTLAEVQAWAVKAYNEKPSRGRGGRPGGGGGGPPGGGMGGGGGGMGGGGMGGGMGGDMGGM